MSSSWKRFGRAVFALALTALVGTRADASIDAKSKPVLDRYLKVTGGRDAWQADSTTHAHFHVKAFTLEGTVDRWSARPDRSVTSTRLGPLSLSEGTSGGKAWRIDQNGKLQWLDGPELADALGENYLDQELFLAPDQGGGSIRYLRRDGTGDAAVDVLEVTPPKGRARQLSFSVATGYLMKSLQPGDAQTVETTLYEYSLQAGRQRPQRSLAKVVGMPANDVEITSDSLRASVAVDPPLFLPPEGMAKDYRFLGSTHSTTMPMRYSQRHVWLKVSINGEPPEDFLLDTGASVTVIDSVYAAKLGLVTHGSLQGTGAGSSGQFAFTKVNTIHVAGDEGSGIELAAQNVVVAPLSKYLESYFWRTTPGVLGYDFLSRFVTTIDYENQKLTFTDPDAYKYTGKGQAVPISFSDGVPVVHAKMDGVEGEFRLDVGSGSSVDLHTPFVEKNNFRAKAKKTVEAPGAGFGGSFDMDMARLPSFSIGSYVIADPLVGLTRTQTGTFSGQDFAGNVGNRILDRFRLTLDYAKKMVYFEPNTSFGKRDEFGQFGAQVVKQGDQIVVGFVADGTPAARSGLKVGDIVVAINGKDANSYSVDQVYPLLEESPTGTEISFHVIRGGQTHDFKVKLEPIL